MNFTIFTGYSGFTQRTNNIAALIKNEFPKSEINTIVFGKNNYHFLKSQLNVAYSDILCVEDLLEYCNKQTYIPTDENIQELERKLGHSLNYLLHTERIFTQHTHDLIYNRKLSQAELNKFIYFLIIELEKFIVNSNVVFVYTCASIVSEILYFLCKQMNKAHYAIFESRFPQTFFLSKKNYDYLIDDIDSFYSKNEVSNEGKEIIKKLTSKLNNQNFNPTQAQVITNIHSKKSLKIKNITRFLLNLFNNSLHRHYLAPNNVQRIKINILYQIRKHYVGNFFDKDIPKVKFVYFPLSTSPEASTLVRAQKYYDNLSLIKLLARELPISWKLLIREHPGMIGKRSINFYRQLKNIFNVQIVSDLVAPLECIKNAEATITITGTSGFESMLLGKKTIVLGNTMYSRLKSVFKINRIEDIGAILRKNWNKDNILNQQKDLEMLASYFIKEKMIKDDDKLLWSKKSIETIEEREIDRDIYYKLMQNLEKDFDIKDNY